MSGRDANQLAADAERSLRQVLVQYVRAMGELGWTMANVQPEKALDELVALVGTLQQGASRMDSAYQEAELIAHQMTTRAEAAEAALAEARESVANLCTRPGTCLAAAGGGTEHPGLEDAVGPAPKDQATLTPFESSAKPGITLGSTQGSTVDSKKGQRS